MALPQVTTLNDDGVIVTIGIVVNNDRCAIVFPLVRSLSLDPVAGCKECVLSIEANLHPALLDCLSSGAQLSFTQVEGMIDGRIPSRHNYAAGTLIGTRGAQPLPSQTGGLITFYEDPEDVEAGHKMGTAKTILPGIANDDVVGDTLVVVLRDNLFTLGSLMAEGFVSSADPTVIWQRPLSAPVTVTENPDPPPANLYTRPAGQECSRIASVVVPGYVATVRKRITPH